MTLEYLFKGFFILPAMKRTGETTMNTYIVKR